MEEQQTFDESVMQEGYVFNGLYPPEAAYWCNSHNGYYIDEITEDPEETDYAKRKFIVRKLPDPTPEQIAFWEMMNAKSARAESIKNAVVQVDGLSFDANETAQSRMQRACGVLSEDAPIKWVLSDNSVADITVATLKQALKLAVENQVNIWAEPYTQA